MTYVCTFISIVVVLLGSLVLDDKMSPDHLSWIQGGLIGLGALIGAVFDWRALRPDRGSPRGRPSAWRRPGGLPADGLRRRKQPDNSNPLP